MYERILITTDGSPAAEAAARHGIELARALAATVHLLTTTGPFELPPGFQPSPALPVQSYIDATVAEARARLGRLEKLCAKAGVAHHSAHLGTDRTAQTIVAHAEATRCELVVMGSHGRGSVAQVLLGSVVTRVVATSRVPVLVVRDTSADAAAKPAKTSKPSRARRAQGRSR
jgi:nucleotide-binding universal stress UspA family protein